MNDIKAIKAAAEAATQGDWSIVGTGKCIDIRFGDNCVNQVLVKWTGFEASDLSIKKTRANAKHIATASPATVIALCEEIERLKGSLRGAESLIENMQQQITNLQEQNTMLDAKLAEVDKDAARYQWLVTYFVSDRDDQDDAIVSASKVGVTQVTAVIDAAMEAK